MDNLVDFTPSEKLKTWLYGPGKLMELFNTKSEFQCPFCLREFKRYPCDVKKHFIRDHMLKKRKFTAPNFGERKLEFVLESAE